MPDWRNPDDYAYTEKLRLHDWAWEFLRRNPAYRLAWDSFLIAVEADRIARRSTDGAETLEPMSAAYDDASKVFGLVTPIDPDLLAAETSEVLWRESVGVTILDGWNPAVRENRPWPGFPRIIGLSFDFTHPLKPQIAQATDVLNRCAQTLQGHGVWEEDPKPKVRVDRSRFTLYLRLLDAQESATLGEMGRRLFKNHSDQRKSAKNALHRARWMSENGYRELLLMANR